MPKQISLRTIWELREDAGQIPQNTLDKTLSLSGFTGATVLRFQLAAAADDYEVAFTDALVVAIYSSNYAFSWRLAAGETLVGNARRLEMVADDTADGLLSGPILLTGNGTYPCDMTIWIVEKP